MASEGLDAACEGSLHVVVLHKDPGACMNAWL